MIYIKIRKQSWQLKQNKNNNIIKIRSNNKIFTRIFAAQCNILIVKTRTTKAQLSEKRIENLQPIPAIFTPATIKNG